MSSYEARSKKTLKTIGSINDRLERIETKLDELIKVGLTTADAAKLAAELKGEPTPPSVDNAPANTKPKGK